MANYSYCLIFILYLINTFKIRNFISSQIHNNTYEMRGVGSEMPKFASKRVLRVQLTFTCIGLPYNRVVRTHNSII